MRIDLPFLSLGSRLSFSTYARVRKTGSTSVGLVGTNVEVTLEVDAQIPEGAPENVVRTVTENARTLRFKSQGFEKE